jgi:PAS domain S-box-containing protein
MKKPVSECNGEKIPGKTAKNAIQHQLRQVVEVGLSERGVTPELTAGTREQAMHELRVPRIELEMQNSAMSDAMVLLDETRDEYIDPYDYAPVGYLILSKEAVIMEANLTVANLLGIERHILVKERIRKFVACEDLELWDQYFTAVLRNRGKQGGQLKFRTAAGSLISTRLETIWLNRDNSEPVIRMALSDITDRVKYEESLARKSHNLDELSIAHQKIDATEEQLKKTVTELTARENELRGALAEKEMLLSEIHHRVKNNLTTFISLISLEGSHEESPAWQALKNDLQNRARSMAIVHETVYQTKKYSQVDMDIYLTNLEHQIAGTFPGSERICTTINADGMTLDIARATPCGLIITELITNSLKHAFPRSFNCKISRRESCRIGIVMTKTDDHYQLKVFDNGIGLPEKINYKTARSLGLKLVNILAQHQLRATIRIKRDKGTEFLIRFGTSTVSS